MAQAKRSPAKALKFWESLQPLVELYNLHLSPASSLTDIDREKIKGYLHKNAPDIFLRETDPLSKYGTLLLFQKIEGKDWFSGEYFVKFLSFCESLRCLLDLYVDQKFTGKYLATLQELLLEFKPTFALRNRATGEFYSIGAHWGAPLDTKRYELVWGGGVVSTGGILDKYRLDIGDLLARLVFSLYRIIAEGVRVLRCQRRGCLDIFIAKPRAPTGDKAPKYCPRCRSRRKK